MLDMKRSFLAPLLGLAVATIATDAHAGMVTYSATTGAMKLTDFKQTLSVPAFDSSLGQLESVVFSISDAGRFSGSILNKSASARNFDVSETLSFGLSFGSTQLVSTELAAQTPFKDILSGQIATFGTFNLTGNSGPTTIIDPTLLDDFTGTSPLDFSFATVTEIVVTGAGGNTSNIFHTLADAQVSVTYNYFSPNVVVPEPASLAMTALGGLLVAAGWLGKRKRLGAAR